LKEDPATAEEKHMPFLYWIQSSVCGTTQRISGKYVKVHDFVQRCR